MKKKEKFDVYRVYDLSKQSKRGVRLGSDEIRFLERMFHLYPTKYELVNNRASREAIKEEKAMWVVSR